MLQVRELAPHSFRETMVGLPVRETTDEPAADHAQALAPPLGHLEALGEGASSATAAHSHLYSPAWAQNSPGSILSLVKWPG